MRKLIVAVMLASFAIGSAQAGAKIDGILHVKLQTSTQLPNAAERSAGVDLLVADDVTTFGAVGQYALLPNLAFNASLALFKPDYTGMDEGLTLQGGASYKFFTYSDMFDVIGRGGLAIPIHDDFDAWILHADALGRLPIKAVPGLKAYGSLGLALYDYEHDGGVTDDGLEITLGVGAQYSFAQRFTCHGGLEVASEPAFSLGFRISF